MDNCFIDITVEFLAVAFHNILYYGSVYPGNVFDTRRKYSVVVYRCRHPEVNHYINSCLKSVEECLKCGTLRRLEFAVTNDEYNPIVKFVFHFDKNSVHEENSDAYLVQVEQNLRAFCLNLNTIIGKFQNNIENKSFTIFLHTNESSAVSMSINPDLQEFPYVEVEDKTEDCERILPLRRFELRGYSIDTYVEIK
ncbi:Mitotic spindle assembly checkpoint protein MAD2B [Papilio xuthus]|uniref:Mitotic spindle assembly checkpoint protein MAD2B n=1 Tax=Papilio xuthus TaxID=66420 RepID=A0A194PR29_PAPXU|nr:Mitotic spindle assembly checkpoint protein MAD2B [Papilio xuthus]